jgi:hypothetical protein
MLLLKDFVLKSVYSILFIIFNYDTVLIVFFANNYMYVTFMKNCHTILENFTTELWNIILNQIYMCARACVCVCVYVCACVHIKSKCTCHFIHFMEGVKMLMHNLCWADVKIVRHPFLSGIHICMGLLWPVLQFIDIINLKYSSWKPWLHEMCAQVALELGLNFSPPQYNRAQTRANEHIWLRQ